MILCFWGQLRLFILGDYDFYYFKVLKTNLNVKLFILNSVEMLAQTSTWESRLYSLELELYS